METDISAGEATRCALLHGHLHNLPTKYRRELALRPLVDRGTHGSTKGTTAMGEARETRPRLCGAYARLVEETDDRANGRSEKP